MKLLLYEINGILQSADKNIKEIKDTAIKLFKMKHKEKKEKKMMSGVSETHGKYPAVKHIYNWYLSGSEESTGRLKK